MEHFLLDSQPQQKENPSILLEDYRAMLANPEFHALMPEHVSFVERNVMVLESMAESMVEQ